MIELLYQILFFGFAGGALRVLIGYSKAYGILGYAKFNIRRAVLTLVVALISSVAAPLLIGADSIGVAFIAGFAGTDLLEALAKGLMKLKTGFSTGFAKNRYSEFGEGFSDTKTPKKFQKALEYIDKNGKITNNEYEKLNRVSDATSSRDLKKLVNMGLIKKIGSGKNTYYKLK